MLTDEMKSMAYLINKEILKIFPYEYIKDVCSGEITMKEIIDQIMMECCKYAYDNSLETHSLDYYMGGATKANDSDRMMYQCQVVQITLPQIFGGLRKIKSER